MPNESEFVFPSRTGRGPVRDIRRTVERAFVAAEIWKADEEGRIVDRDGVTPHHVFRHTFTTLAAELGLGDMVIAAMVGHRLGTMTSRYAHLTVDGIVRDAERKVQARIAAALSSPALSTST